MLGPLMLDVVSDEAVAAISAFPHGRELPPPATNL